MEQPGSDTALVVDHDVVVSEGRVRLIMTGYADEQATEETLSRSLAYDGEQMLIHDEENAVGPYTLVESPSTTRWPGSGDPVLGYIAQYVPFDPTSELSQWLCPDATQVEDGSDLGRPATLYSCSTIEQGKPDEVWIDEEFGFVLSPLLPYDTLFDTQPEITADTFVTTPPVGVEVDVLEPPAAAGAVAPDFVLREVPAVAEVADGSFEAKTVTGKDLAGSPYVLAIVGDGLLFDAAAPEAVSLRALSELTAGGTEPKVIGVVVTASEFVEKGDMFGELGWQFPMTYDDGEVLHNFGLSGDVAFAFVNADGTISSTNDGAMTDAELQVALDQLR